MGIFRTGTKRGKIEQLKNAGLPRSEAFRELSFLVRDQQAPWVFTRNVNGSRVAKPISDQLIELEHEINRVYSLLDRRGQLGDKLKEEKSPPQKPEEKKEEIQKPPRAKGKLDKDAEKHFFFSEWQRLRKFIADAAAKNGSVTIDSLDSNRPVEAARALIDAGISASTLVYSMVCHWPQVSRDMAKVATADFMAESENLGDEFHKLAGYVLKLAQARQNIMLIGPAGSGKSYLAKQIAGLIKTDAHPNGLPYGETPMTPGATRGDLLGRHTVSGFISSQFVEIYSGGGVFNFEEIDASDPSMLIVLNNALASQQLFNSANGEVYEKHPDFIAVATANTFGMGSDTKYTGREKLDLATIDRFRMGRVMMELDEELAYRIMFG